MTEYSYKWVSATTEWAPGVSALQHAVDSGWERVPFGKFPDGWTREGSVLFRRRLHERRVNEQKNGSINAGCKH